VFAVAIDDGSGRGAGEPACRGLEDGGNLLADHQAGFAPRAILLFRKLLQPKTKDLAGFDGEHGACKPRKAVTRSAADDATAMRGQLRIVHHRGAPTRKGRDDLNIA
jgi:hypothetical protein